MKIKLSTLIKTVNHETPQEAKPSPKAVSTDRKPSDPISIKEVTPFIKAWYSEWENRNVTPKELERIAIVAGLEDDINAWMSSLEGQTFYGLTVRKSWAAGYWYLESVDDLQRQIAEMQAVEREVFGKEARELEELLGRPADHSNLSIPDLREYVWRLRAEGKMPKAISIRCFRCESVTAHTQKPCDKEEYVADWLMYVCSVCGLKAYARKDLKEEVELP